MTKLKNGTKGGVFIVPSNLAIFGDFWKFCFAHNIGAFRKFWFVRNYLCPPMGYLLSPPTWQFLEIFGSFGLRIIICALRWGIYCPLQLGDFFWDFRKFCFAHNFWCPSFQQFWQFAKVFVSSIIICALRFCGVSCVLHAALAAYVCCSILSISKMMCGIRNFLRMFWWCVAGWCFVQ